MCGIAGFLRQRGGEAAMDFVMGRMLATLHHRGPDDGGSWTDPATGCAIGMRRLSIIDEAGGHQPIWNEDHTIGIVFNGEIYNHAGLRSELTARGHTFRTRSDTEVLVHLYEERGTAMFEQLQGMYALALLDRARDRLLLARDPFGMKPLYWCALPCGGAAFASEIKAFAVLSEWSGTLDTDAYFDYATWLSLPAPRTHWTTVTKFAPGEWRVHSIRTGQLEQQGVCSGLTFSAAPDLLTVDDAADALGPALLDSVQRHLQADVPVGLLLSGGSDSLALALTVSQATDQRLHTFTAGLAGEANEFDAARRSAALCRSHHHEVELSAAMLEREATLLTHHLDEPIGDPAAVAVLAVCRAARPHVKVLLGGEGADELFAGYAGRYEGLLRSDERQQLAHRWLRWLPRLGSPDRSGRWNRLQLAASRPAGAELLTARIDGLGPAHPWTRKHAGHLLPIWRQRIDAVAQSLAQQESESALSFAQRLDLGWQLPESLLVKSDRMSMAASVELRCPYLDPVVAAVAGRVAESARFDRSRQVGKLPLRALLARHLSGEDARPKLGFPLPLGRWLRTSLADDLQSRLTDPDSAFVGLVGQTAAQSWCSGFMRGELSGHITYALWLYEVWRADQAKP